MANLGFIIPLNLNDYLPFTGKPQGDRTNWCSAPPPEIAQPVWTNDNIQLSGGSLGTTSAKVGETVSIQVGVQGVNGHSGHTVGGDVDIVQAWVCYPNSVAGGFGPLVPSMTTGPTPAKELTALQAPISGSSNFGNYQRPGPHYTQFTLDNPWTPQAEDIIPPNTDAHCCIQATCYGFADIDDAGPRGEVGLFVRGTDRSGIDICNDPHQGQVNITILPIQRIGVGRTLPGDFGFLSGGVASEERARVVVEVTPLAQPNGIDPAVLRVLQAGPWSGLPLRPATLDPRGLGLRKNPHRCEGWLAEIICEADEFIEDLIEAVEGRPDHDRRGRRITLTLPPHGLQPMLLQMELDASEAPGTVHVFDIVQTDPSGRRGGIRVGAIVVP